MVPFPYSFALIPLLAGLGVVYVTIGRRRGPWPNAARLGILIATVLAPALTTGPGPAQLTLGLLCGYLGIRMVGLSRRKGTAPNGAHPSNRRIFLSLVTPDDLVAPATRSNAGPGFSIVATGLVGVAACLMCILLLVLGNQWRLWQRSPLLFRFLDDQLVLLEVAVGAAGVHRLIVAIAALVGHSVQGLQDHPLHSASLSEFWARRWNHLVQNNLARAFFRGHGRARRPGRGVLAAFAASGVLHVLAVVSAGPMSLTLAPSAVVMGFFIVHGGLVLLERRVGWHRAPRRPLPLFLARARTVAIFAALSPLLLDPFASVTHVHGRTLGSINARPAADQNFKLTPALP